MSPKFSGYWPDDTLWPRIQQAAREASAREGRDISASEWLADAAEQKLRRETKQRRPR